MFKKISLLIATFLLGISFSSISLANISESSIDKIAGMIATLTKAVVEKIETDKIGGIENYELIKKYYQGENYKNQQTESLKVSAEQMNISINTSKMNSFYSQRYKIDYSKPLDVIKTKILEKVDEVEIMKVGGKENFYILSMIFQSETYESQQKESLNAALEQLQSNQ